MADRACNRRTATLIAVLPALPLALSVPAYAQSEPAKPPPAEACNNKLQQLTKTYGVEPRNVIDAASERTVQFRTADASVIVICDKTNGGVITTVTPYQCSGSTCRQKPPEAPPGH